MVTLITEQLRKQSLEEPYYKAFSFNVNASLPAVGSSPTVSWSACRSTQETSSATHPSSKANLLDDFCGPDPLGPPSRSGEAFQSPEVSFTDEVFQSSPPPPPPKRHCRSLSVPEDLSQCRSTWHPSASKVWTPVKRGCQSGGLSSSGSAASSLPLCGPSSSFTSSSLHSSSSPTFFSLALSDSPLPWSFPWDPCDQLKGTCSASFATPSSCSSSPAPMVSHSVLQRRFSLSPVHIHGASSVLLPPHPSPASALTYDCSGVEHPALSPSPTSACSTPSSSRRDLHPALPRCRSQPCDMRRPRLKRRRDPDVLPCPRPGLNFSKMTQMMSLERLTCGWLQQLLLVLLVLCLTFAGPLRPLNGTECTAKGPASYILVFTGHWSPQAFPKQYPLFRPPAQWSKLLAVSHNGRFRLWEEGAPASAGVQNFSELGVTVELMKAAKEARKKRAVGAMYRTAGIPNGVGHSSTELLMQPRCSLLSLMVKMIPSPDWFVGVDSLNLCEGGRWKQEVTFDLQPYDAGTDSGFTFSSPNFPTSPVENITKITSQLPNHPANSFYYPRLKELPPIASIKITRQSRSPDHQAPMSNHILPNSISPQRFSVTPLDCEVSLWSSWGLCLGPCSRGGVRHRTRYILLRPANAGTPCPELEEQAECVPHSCMRLK